MKRKASKYIFYIGAILVLATIVLMFSFTSKSQQPVTTAGSKSIPTTISAITAPPPKVFVTHTIVNPGQLPLRVTIQARDATNFDEIEIFIDAGNGYEKITCKSLPCDAPRNYTQPGIVKYYAVVKSKDGAGIDPAGAPASYKSFRVG